MNTKTLLLITLAWAVAAYLIVPKLWALYFRRHPFLTQRACITETHDGHPGDPINIALLCDEATLVGAMAGGRLVRGEPDHRDEQRAHRRRYRAAPP